MTLYGGIEAGGTKFVCGVGNWEHGSLEKTVIPTRDPGATYRDVAAFFRPAEPFGPVAGLGIASFGPLDLDPASRTFGQILATPKPHWSGVDLLQRTRAVADMPLGLDTDVNAAALAEATAAGAGITHLAYVTVG